MFANSKAFSGFSVNDTGKAKAFYGEVLGLGVTDVDVENGLVSLTIAGSRDIFVYTKPDHTPASFTILNFPVPDVEKAVDELTAKSVEFLHYDGFEQDGKGISRSDMGTIAWFTDPAGNVLSVLSES